MHENPIGVIHDVVLGEIPYTPDDLRLFQTSEMTRLREVSLSATPPWVLTTSHCMSKFTHSVAVAKLARTVGKKKSFSAMARDLYFAALVHDVATPPFSHLSERFLVRIHGVNHEEFLTEVLEGSEVAREIRHQGGDLGTILKLAQGNLKPWSDAINGSVDVDNLHNSLGYGLSLGILNRHEAYYDPITVTQSFGIHDNTFCLDWEAASALDAWVEVRRKVYKFVYSPQNLTVGTMLFRALELARREDELPKTYFSMTDMEAFQYLASKCNHRTRRLLERIHMWYLHTLVYEYETKKFGPALSSFLKQEDTRSALADRICSELGFQLEDVTVHASITKGIRSITIPLLFDDGGMRPYRAMEEGASAVIQVYCATGLESYCRESVAAIMSDILSQYS